MEAWGSSETSVKFYQVALHDVSAHNNVHSHCGDSLESRFHIRLVFLGFLNLARIIIKSSANKATVTNFTVERHSYQLGCGWNIYYELKTKCLETSSKWQRTPFLLPYNVSRLRHSKDLQYFINGGFPLNILANQLCILTEIFHVFPLSIQTNDEIKSQKASIEYFFNPYSPIVLSHHNV
jgi:hypothetical protein